MARPAPHRWFHALPRLIAAGLLWLLGLVALPAIGPELPAPDGEVIVIPAGLEELPAQRRAELIAHPPQAPPVVLEAVAASSFSQPAPTAIAVGVVVSGELRLLGVAVYSADYVGTSDPVNKWDPSGLDWEWNPGSRVWEEIPDTDPVPDPNVIGTVNMQIASNPYAVRNESLFTPGENDGRAIFTNADVPNLVSFLESSPYSRSNVRRSGTGSGGSVMSPGAILLNSPGHQNEVAAGRAYLLKAQRVDSWLERMQVVYASMQQYGEPGVAGAGFGVGMWADDKVALYNMLTSMSSEELQALPGRIAAGLTEEAQRFGTDPGLYIQEKAEAGIEGVRQVKHAAGEEMARRGWGPREAAIATATAVATVIVIEMVENRITQGFDRLLPGQRRNISELPDAVKKADALDAGQRRAYDDLIDRLSQDIPGKNQHALKGDLKGWSAADLAGSGKGRGKMRVLFRVREDGGIEVRDIVDYHSK